MHVYGWQQKRGIEREKERGDREIQTEKGLQKEIERVTKRDRVAYTHNR